jgi:hypothetical protein
MTIATQQQAEIIKPGYYALELDPIDQKNGKRDFCFANMIQERVLQIVRLFSHGLSRPQVLSWPADCPFRSALSPPSSLRR